VLTAARPLDGQAESYDADGSMTLHNGSFNEHICYIPPSLGWSIFRFSLSKGMVTSCWKARLNAQKNVA